MIRKIIFPASLLATGCFNNDEGGNNPLDKTMLSRTVISSSTYSDTVLHRYDQNGVKLKDSSISGGITDWDNLGRNIGSRRAGDPVGDTINGERIDWITNDSVIRTSSFQKTNEKLFNWKSSCWRASWCSDSVYHFRFGSGFIAKGFTQFDSIGNPTIELFAWSSGMIDTLHNYEYSYNNNKQIIRATDYDRETIFDTVLILFEYDKLSNLIMTRN